MSNPHATVTVFGIPLELVEDGFTPDLPQLTVDELVFAYAEAEEWHDEALMDAINDEMQARRG